MNRPTCQQFTWPDSRTFWQNKRVIVTGGSGFLGSFVVDKLHARGAAEVIVPRRADYDLRDITAIRQLFADVHNSQLTIHNLQLVVIHLAAHVGGIGANRVKPAEFFYDNLMMGGAAHARGVARGCGEVHRHRHSLRLSPSFDKPKPRRKPCPELSRKLDVSRAQERFEFQSHTSFDDGLQQTIEWRQRNK